VNSMSLAVGPNTITAAYSGANGFNASAATTTVTVTAGGSAVVPSVSPNPVYIRPPNASGDIWSFTIRLTNQGAASTTLTKLIIGGTDYTSNIVSWFGSATIPSNGSISASLTSKSPSTTHDESFSFSGTDAGGATWSQSLTVPFVARLVVAASVLMVTPSSVVPVPAADPSCRWQQPLVIEEQGGYESVLTTLVSGSTDFSAQLQQIFGTTTLAPFGRLQGTLCWPSTASGSKSLSLSGDLAEFATATVSSSVSSTLAATSTTVVPSVSPASVTLSPQSTSATVSLSFTSGTPAWTARVSPSNLVTSWLALSPSSGTGAGQLKLTASPAGLATGVYNATLLIQTTGASPQFTSVPVVLVVGGSSLVTIGAVTNAASYKTQVAPGMLMTVWGTNLAPASQHAPSVPLPWSMQGVSVTVNGYPAPLLDVTPGQLNVQVPYETGGGTAIVGVNNNGRVASYAFQVQPSAPGIFMTLDGASNLVPYASGQRGQILLAFITGEGDVAPTLTTGRAPTTTDISKLPAPGLPVSVTVGGVPATIVFAGIPGGLVGVTQINFTIPPNAPLGKQPVVVTVGGVASAPVNLTVTQ